MPYITESQRLSFLVARGAAGGRLEDFLAAELKRFLAGDRRAEMLTGERYYRNENDILSKNRDYTDAYGTRLRQEGLANNAAPHAFMRALTDQKTGYLLARPFSFQTRTEAYGKRLGELFDEDMRCTIKDLGEEAIVKGCAWLHVYYDEVGAFRVMRLPSEQVLPFWADAAHTRLDAVLRCWDTEDFSGGYTAVTRAEFWDADGVRRYTVRGGALVPDGDGLPAPHAVREGAGFNWDTPPFVCFKYNGGELPLLRFVKGLIDDYDARRAENADNLQDMPNAVYVLRNYDGTDLAQFRRNLALHRAVKVSGEGGVDTLSTPAATQSVNAHIDVTRRDIFAMGRGVDPTDERTGGISGVALRFLYAHLDTDCNIMEAEFKKSLRRLLWFYTAHLKNIGAGDFTGERAEFQFNRDIIINESEAIQAVRDSDGLLSRETLLSMHPGVTDVWEELGRIDREGVKADG